MVSDIELSARLREQLRLSESGRRVLSPFPELSVRDVRPSPDITCTNADMNVRISNGSLSSLLSIGVVEVVIIPEIVPWIVFVLDN
jgi:hypothetical protein